jgi:hypothetical protein
MLFVTQSMLVRLSALRETRFAHRGPGAGQVRPAARDERVGALAALRLAHRFLYESRGPMSQFFEMNWRRLMSGTGPALACRFRVI